MSDIFRSRQIRVVGVAAVLLLAVTTGVWGGQATGGLLGQVDLPELPPGAVVQVLLMPPEWAVEWNNDVQERLRVYSANNGQAVERDRSLFDRIAYRARREAVAYVGAQMQGELGIEAYERLVADVGSDGTFEYEGLAFGEYQVIVVAQGGGVSYLWAQPVRIAGAIPQFVDMGPVYP